MTFTEDEPKLPSIEALVAATFALMTTWADPNQAAAVPVAKQRAFMARKIVSNLFYLQHHPNVSDALRRVFACSHERWVAIARSECCCTTDSSKDIEVRVPTTSGLVH